MQIEAGGKTWIVEEQKLSGGPPHASDRFFGVSFRNIAYDSDILHVRWAMKPEVLTPRMARELFDMAGIRVWRDSRDGCVYRVHLETRVPDPRSRSQRALEAVRFEWDERTAETRWTLGKPLGCASDAELMDLLDLARAS